MTLVSQELLRSMGVGELETLQERIEGELKERDVVHPVDKTSQKRACRALGCNIMTRKVYLIGQRLVRVHLCGKHRYEPDVELKPHLPPEAR